MLDEDGNIIHDELIYVRTASPWDTPPDLDDEDEERFHYQNYGRRNMDNRTLGCC